MHSDGVAQWLSMPFLIAPITNLPIFEESLSRRHVVASKLGGINLVRLSCLSTTTQVSPSAKQMRSACSRRLGT